jgi:hypothetical protein
MSALNTPFARPLLLAGLLTVVGCSGGIDTFGGDYFGPPVYGEHEPNDSPWEPDILGLVDTHSNFIVEGYVEAVGWDTVDTFEIEASEPVAISFELYGDSLFADLDLCLFDPDIGQVVACYDGSWNPEEGYFTLDWPGKRVVLMVEAYLVDSSYSLEILASPLPYNSDSGDPSSSPVSLTSGSGISFPDGQPQPSERKRGPDAPDEQTLVFALQNQAVRDDS